MYRLSFNETWKLEQIKHTHVPDYYKIFDVADGVIPTFKLVSCYHLVLYGEDYIAMNSMYNEIDNSTNKILVLINFKDAPD